MTKEKVIERIETGLKNCGQQMSPEDKEMFETCLKLLSEHREGRLMDRGIELVSIGRIETKDECLLEILKDNGFYLKYEKMPKYDREYYIIMAPKED